MFLCASLCLIVIVLISVITAQIVPVLFVNSFFYPQICFILSTNEIQVTQIFVERISI